MAKTQTLSFPQGASYLIPFQCRSRGSTPANYTGWKILFVVKKNLTDGDDAALINQLIVPASDTGYNELLLNGDETYEFPVGRYYYQAVVVDATGTVGKSEVGLFVVEETTLRSNAGTYVGPNPPLNPPATAGLIFNARQPIYLDITLITSSGMSAAIYDPQHIQADAFARVNHTGTQAISTVSGLQAALDANSSAISSHITNTSNPHAVTKAQVGLANVDNTADAAKNVLSATKLTTPRTINGVSFDGTGNITITDATKEPTIGAGTTAQYWRGDKSWQTLDKTAVGLSNVDNTSDANKPVSTATQTALNAKQDAISIPQYSAVVRNAAGTGEITGGLTYQVLAGSNTLMQRSSTGTSKVNSPIDSDDITNKSYVDTADALKVNKAGDNMTGRLGNATSNLASSNTRGGKEILYGATAVGNFGVLNNTDGIEVFNAMSDGSGIRLGTSTGLAILKGTGFPNGVFTAPVGSIYIDTSATSGALQWMKASGTGNTGWVVSVGDTGWRDVTALIPVSSTTGGQLRMRRVLNRIYIQAVNLYLTSTSEIALIPDIGSNLGAEWRPIENVSSVISINSSGVNVKFLNIRPTHVTLGLSHIGDTNSRYWTSAYDVASNWPTTLPGTAA